MIKRQKRAVIFGITGQDGSHLADLLLSKDYKVFGISRRASTDNLYQLYPTLIQAEQKRP